MLKNLTVLASTIIFLQQSVFSQKINGEIFIPLNNRSEIWVKPQRDTLENKKEYEFRIRVSPEFTISQFLFEKGLAVHNDSVLVITPNSTKWGDYDTATLRVIVTSITGSRIFLFQKRFIIKVPPKEFPVITNPKTNLIKLNDKVFLERNRPYPKQMFTVKQPFVALYDNEVNLKPLNVTGVTIALYEKEGKNYASTGDTISMVAIHELKKIRDPVPVFIKVDALSGKIRKSVWNRIILYDE